MTFAKPVSILGGVRTVMRGPEKERERARLCTIQLSYNMARRRELLAETNRFSGGSQDYQQLSLSQFYSVNSKKYGKDKELPVQTLSLEL